MSCTHCMRTHQLAQHVREYLRSHPEHAPRAQLLPHLAGTALASLGGAALQVNAAVVESSSLLQELPPLSPPSPAAAVQLDVCMGPAGTQQPYHLAPFGSYRWLHVHSGTLVVRMYPGTTSNLKAFLKHQQAPQQGLLLQLEGQQPERCECCVGQGILIPPGWLTSLQFQEACVLVGAHPSCPPDFLPFLPSCLPARPCSARHSLCSLNRCHRMCRASCACRPCLMSASMSAMDHPSAPQCPAPGWLSLPGMP